MEGGGIDGQRDECLGGYSDEWMDGKKEGKGGREGRKEEGYLDGWMKGGKEEWMDGYAGE